MKFKVVNIGLIIALIINFVISFAIVAMFAGEKYGLALGITIVIFVCSIGILFTPVGDWWYRNIVFKLREPNELEAKRLIPIYQEVYGRAIKAVPNLPRNIHLYIHDNDTVNAMAIGLRTIAVHRGMLIYHLHDDEIAAILGHEFAHIANGDTMCTILAFQSNSIVHVFRSVLMIIVRIFAVFLGWIMTIVTDNDRDAENTFTITETIVRFMGWLLDKCISIIVGISVIIAQYSRRKHELSADSFSADLGYRQPMLHYFRRSEELKQGKTNVLSFAYLLHGTHPSTGKRIENLQL